MYKNDESGMFTAYLKKKLYSSFNFLCGTLSPGTEGIAKQKTLLLNKESSWEKRYSGLNTAVGIQVQSLSLSNTLATAASPRSVESLYT